MNVLVTGGAGYIGSHTSQALLEAGFKVIILDDLSTGFRQAVPSGAEFIEGKVHDLELVTRILKEKNIQAVLHFAAKLVVPESVSKPLEYYDNNVVGTLRLLQACELVGVNRFVFSSTAAVYGQGSGQALNETDPLLPINPYGTTKLVSEFQLRDFGQALRAQGRDFKYVVLRYFNVAGASASGKNGQRSKVATHLIKIASQVAVGLRPSMQVFGQDYKTPDGTCIRDYIHVEDLAEAHVCALQAIIKDHPGGTFNCGYGRGFSVIEVLDTLRKVSPDPIKTEMGPRRPGDPDILIANSRRLKDELHWTPKREDLALICRSAYLWEKQILKEQS